jgi:hypothetical protein
MAGQCKIVCIVRAMPPKKPVKKPARAAGAAGRGALRTAAAKAAASRTGAPPVARRGKRAAPPVTAAPPRRAPRRNDADITASDPALFAPLTPGEVAAALRTLTEDRRMATTAKVGRYRVIATEPLVVKPPHFLGGHRLARVVIYDYAADRSIDACVDLDASVVAHVETSRAQPMLSRDEEAVSIQVALQDSRVRDALSLGEEPLVCAHYWGKDATDLAFARRSAAVIFGRPGGAPSLVAVVDLLDNLVTAVVPAAQW